MPLLKQWNIDDGAVAAIWKIEEPVSFFEEKTGLNPEIKNERKRTEHLAGRFLLQFLIPDLPIHEIRKDEHDKPRLINNSYFFSISHSYPYVAVIVDTQKEAGIDIQTFRDGIVKMQYKYLSEQERTYFNNDVSLLTLAWSVKEAVYKWNGKRGLEFIEGIPIVSFDKDDITNITVNFNFNNIEHLVLVENILTIDFVCSWVINPF